MKLRVGKAMVEVSSRSSHEERGLKLYQDGLDIENSKSLLA